MPRALIFTHSHAPGRGERQVGSVRPALNELGYDVVTGSFVPGGGSEPRTNDVDLLVVMGSAASAYDDDVPWLAAELEYLRSALAASTPVLGICFGAQLLVRALGGTVSRAPAPERGFVTLESADSAVLPAGTWFEYHYDTFTLPPSAVELARNGAGLQAFVHGMHMGVQFHPEITTDAWGAWLDEWSSTEQTATEAAVDLPALTAQIRQREAESIVGCRELITRYCARLPAVRAGR